MHSLLSGSLAEETPVEEAHQQIDKNIKTHQVSVLALKSQRNRFAPISRLPPEILARIFSFVKPQNPGYHWRLKWITLTHVIRHWRNIALNSPNLWVDLPIGKLEVVEEMLRRSKDAGLVIKCNLYSNANNTLPGLELALEHSARAVDLSFQYVNAGHWDQLQTHLPQSALRLERLILQGSSPATGSDSDMIFGDYESEPIVITGCLLRETGRLRWVELDRCKIDWNSHSHILRSLLHLKLHNLSRASRPTAEKFVDILKGMPDLEFLDLQDVLPVQTGDTQVSWTSDHIHFASLQILNIRAANNELASFFSCVTFLPTATVKVVCTETARLGYSSSETDFSGIILGLARSYSGFSPAPTFRTIILRKSDIGDGIQLKLYTDMLSNAYMIKHSAYNSKFTPRLELTLLIRSWRLGTFSSFLLGIFNGVMPLQDVVRVYLEDNEIGLGSETIAKTFGILPQVRSAIVGDHLCGPFIDALKVNTHIGGTEKPATIDPKPTIYFPRLSTIYLHEATFRGPWSDDGITTENILDRLVQRFKAGAKIEKLIFRSCRRLEHDDVGMLEEDLYEITGPTFVDWDSKVIFTDSEDDNMGCRGQ